MRHDLLCVVVVLAATVSSGTETARLLVPDAASSPAPPRASALHSGRPIVPCRRAWRALRGDPSAQLVRPVAGIPRRRRRSRRDATIVPCERGRDCRHAPVVLAADFAPRSISDTLQRGSAAAASVRHGDPLPSGGWPWRRRLQRPRPIATKSPIVAAPTRRSSPLPTRCWHPAATTSRSPVRSRSASRPLGRTLPAASPPRPCVGSRPVSIACIDAALRQRRRVRHGRTGPALHVSLPRSRRRTTSRPTASSRAVRSVHRDGDRRPRMAVDAAGNRPHADWAGAASRCATPAYRCRASSGRASSSPFALPQCRRRRSCIRSRPRAGCLPPILEPQIDHDGGVAERRDALRLGRRALHDHPHRRTATWHLRRRRSRSGQRCAAESRLQGRRVSDLLRRQRRRRSARSTADCTTRRLRPALRPRPGGDGGRRARRDPARDARTSVSSRRTRPAPAPAIARASAMPASATPSRPHAPVPLEGSRRESTTARTFSIRESIDGVDRNGDGDTERFHGDDVPRPRQREDRGARRDGRLRAGSPARPDGRAVVRVNQFPFSFPAVSVEGDVVAFLEVGVRPVVRRDRRHRYVGRDRAASSGTGIGETPIVRARAVDAALRIDGAR